MSDPFAFISYRHDDCAVEAALVAETMRAEFGGARVFLDERSIDYGQSIPDYIAAALDRTTVLVVVAGRRWLKAMRQRDAGHRTGTLDWVRHEIGVALARDVPIFPILFRPKAFTRGDLPPDIARLADLKQIRPGPSAYVGINLLLAELEPFGFPRKTPVPIVLRPAPVWPTPTRPYPVLEPYDHPDLFSGREAETGHLAELLEEGRNICICGESGGGKSSLLRAGLVPKLLADGRPCAVVWEPALPKLVMRLLRDLEESPPKIDDDDFLGFLARVTMMRSAARSAPVFVLDQFEEAFRSSSREALGRIGPLLAATRRTAYGGQPPCHWVLAYRKEYHADVREWLHNVLKEARRAGVRSVDSLPASLTDYEEWHLPPIASGPAERNDFEEVKNVFRTIIAKPLSLQVDGQPMFGYTFRADGQHRLAQHFASLRRQDPNASLTPVLQVVLSKFVDTARRAQTKELVVDEDLPALIGNALLDHLYRKLDDAFPDVARKPGVLHRRTQAVLLLRDLLDTKGQRNEGLTAGEIQQRLGDDWENVCDRLGGSQRWLIVHSIVDGVDRWRLPHDLLATAVHKLCADASLRQRFQLDGDAVEMHSVVAKWVDLYQQNRSSVPNAKAMRRIRAVWPTLPKGRDWEKWWRACQESHRNRRVSAAALVLSLVTLVGAVLIGMVGIWSRDVRRTEARSDLRAQDAKKLFAAIRTLDGELRDTPADIASGLPTDPLPIEEHFARDWHAQQVPPSDVANAVRVLVRPLMGNRIVDGAMLAALDRIEADSPSEADLRRQVADARRLVIDALRNLANPAEVIPDTEWARVGNRNVELMAHEVTVAQYAHFDPDPRKHADSDGLVAAFRVSWCEARAFAAWAGYRLPTRQEWVDACEAGDPNTVTAGWTPETATRTGRAERVGQLAKNAWGFYDMIGNVAEWVDGWDPGDGVSRIRMGGSIQQFANRGCQTEYLDTDVNGYQGAGFRLARDIPIARIER
jgi:Sulfatase-modifying factor enzyme 1/TIR domain